jgi:hypothetical protein
MVNSNTIAIRIRRLQISIVLNPVLASSYCCFEYICVPTVVISELKLSNIQMQVFLADLMVSANDAALQDRPEALNGVGVHCANDMLADYYDRPIDAESVG